MKKGHPRTSATELGIRLEDWIWRSRERERGEDLQSAYLVLWREEPVFFFDIYFYFMSTDALPAWLSVLYIFSAGRGQQSTSETPRLELQIVFEPPLRCWESNLGPLEI